MIKICAWVVGIWLLILSIGFIAGLIGLLYCYLKGIVR